MSNQLNNPAAGVHNERVEHEVQRTSLWATAINGSLSFLIMLLLTLVQVMFRNLKASPFQAYPSLMFLFIIDAVIYSAAFAKDISQQATNNTHNYQTLWREICLVSGCFACDLLLLILIPKFGWFIFVFCVSMSVKCIHDHYCLVLQAIYDRTFHIWAWFQVSLQWLGRYVSKAVSRVSPVAVARHPADQQSEASSTDIPKSTAINIEAVLQNN